MKRILFALMFFTSCMYGQRSSEMLPYLNTDAGISPPNLVFVLPASNYWQQTSVNHLILPISQISNLQTTLDSKYKTPTGTILQYLRGDGSLATFPSTLTDNSQLTNGSGFITASSIDTFTNKTGNISQWTNDSSYLTVVPPQSFSSLIGKPTNLSGYGITDAYPLTGNPSNFLTSFTEFDPTVPSYSKSLTGFPIIRTSTDLLYKSIAYVPTSGEVITALGFTPLTNSRTITINGTTFDLTINRSWTVGDLLSTASYVNPSWINSLAYSKLTGVPTIPNNTSQITENSGFLYYTDLRARSSISLTNTGTGISTYNSSTGILNIPTPVIPNDYFNTVAVTGGAGNAIFYLTSDKTSTGTALYTNINFVAPLVNDSNANYTYGWTYNSTTKALTVNVKTNVSTNALLNLLGGLVPVLSPPTNVINGVNVQILVKGN